MTQFSRHARPDTTSAAHGAFAQSPSGQSSMGSGGGNNSGNNSGNSGGSGNGSDGSGSFGSDSARRNPLLSIWTRRWIVVITLAIVVIAAAVQVSRQRPVYEASARLTVERSGPRIVANDPSDTIAQTQNYLNTQCEVLRSRKILSAVANDPIVIQMKTFEGRTDDVVGVLKSRVNATVGRRDDIITVSVRSPIRDDAYQLANAIVDSYKVDLQSAKKSSVKQVIEFYDREKRKAEAELNDARKEILKFQTENPDVSMASDAQVNPTRDRLARFSIAVTETQLALLNAQAAFDATKALSTDPLKIRQLLDSREFKGETADLRHQMRDMQQRYAQVGKTYLPNFPDVGVLQNGIKSLEQELQQEDKKVFDAYLAELEAKLVTTKNNAVQLQTYLDEATRDARKQRTATGQYMLIASKVQNLEQYDTGLAMRIRELSPLSDEAIVNVNVVEEARAQDAVQVEPDVSKTIGMAIFGGLMLGALLAVVRDLIDQRLRSVDEIKLVTGLPVLGVVPHIPQDMGKTAMLRGTTLHNDPTSDVAESYRTIRTSLYFGVPAGTVKTLLITSAAPGEGKSTLASNLAIAMAQAGNRILLLDADFRRPTQYKAFEIDRNIGLSNVLAGKQTLEQAIRPSKVDGLDILPCGPIPANPSEILNSQMFADVLDDLADRYDHVIVDSPPVMPVTDARILAANCDATVIAIRAEKTARKAAVFARDVLRSVGARIVGVVVNDVPRRKGLYGYYYADSQLYRYGYGNAGKPSGGGSSSSGGASPAKSAIGSAAASSPAQVKPVNA